MFCVACSHYQDGTCQIEKIYASGCLKNCPFLGKPEPIITPDGANYQIMTELIEGSDYRSITVSPLKKPGQRGWIGLVMFCYDGKGAVESIPFEPTLPLGAVWLGWQYARKVLQGERHKKLEDFIPLIDMRIGFDYSVVRYLEIKEPRKVSGKTPERKQDKRRKPQKFIPSNNPDLLDVMIPSEETRERGEQLGLFAV